MKRCVIVQRSSIQVLSRHFLFFNKHNETLPEQVLFAIGGWRNGGATNVIEAYNSCTRKWYPVQISDGNLQLQRAYFGTAVIGFKIYLIGGLNDAEYFNSCLCFDAERKLWSQVGYMHERRCYVSIAVVDGLIYAMGGFDSRQPERHKSAEKFDPATNQWSDIAPMNVARSDASAAALDGKIYIFGGFNGKDGLRSVEVYDPATDQWTIVKSMRTRRSGVRCVPLQGLIYVLGGFDGQNRLCCGECYDAKTNRWSSIPNMITKRSNFGLGVLDDKIFVLGGFDGVTTIALVEFFDLKTNKWYVATSMSEGRSALAASVVTRLPNCSDYVGKKCEHYEEIEGFKRSSTSDVNVKQMSAFEEELEHRTNVKIL